MDLECCQCGARICEAATHLLLMGCVAGSILGICHTFVAEEVSQSFFSCIKCRGGGLLGLRHDPPPPPLTDRSGLKVGIGMKVKGGLGVGFGGAWGGGAQTPTYGYEIDQCNIGIILSHICQLSKLSSKVEEANILDIQTSQKGAFFFAIFDRL